MEQHGVCHNFDNYTGSSFEQILLFNSPQMLFNDMKELSIFDMLHKAEQYRISTNKHIAVLWDMKCLLALMKHEAPPLPPRETTRQCFSKCFPSRCI